VNTDNTHSEKIKERGFVLVLTLALLSFLLLLVVTLASTLRIETQTSFNNTQWNNARQNALLGLNVALGQLQELAGPDQRVTATGGIVSNKYSLPNGHDYWTGVWDASNGNFKGWLTSDFIESELESAITKTVPEPNPSSVSVWLVNRSVSTEDSKNEDKQISINKQPIHTTDVPGFSETERVTTGNYAYWISDEGVKASALKTELPIPGQLNAAERNRIRQLSNRMTDLKKISSRVDVDKTPEIDYLFTFDQLDGIFGFSEKSLNENFHNLTPSSLGVYASTLNGDGGGLKDDLSQHESMIDGTLSVNNDLADYWEFHEKSDYVEIRGSSLGGGEPHFPIPLVVPEFSLRLGFARNSSDNGQISIDLNIQADLWNPFTLPVHSIPENSTEEPALFFQITGLPSFEVIYSTDDGIERATFTLSATEPDSDPEDPLSFKIVPLREYQAGEISHVSHTFRFFSEERFIDATPGDPTDDRFTITTSASHLNVTLFDKDELVLQDFVQVPFSEIQSAEEIGMPRVAADETLAVSEMPIRFWFRFLDEGPALEDWSTQLDPRGPRFNFDSDSDVGFLIEVGADIYSGSDADDFITSGEFFSASDNSIETNDQYRFFDLPTLEPISIASLRHLAFDEQKANFLGNPEAENLNRVFDEWFVSTLPNIQNEAEDLIDKAVGINKRPFLNPHTLIPGDTEVAELYGSTEIAKEALLFGAFNINCTSPEVWETILSGNDIDPWVDADSDLENPFFRHPFTADLYHKNPTIRRSWYKTHGDIDWVATYTVGVREITDDQLKDLAKEIVDQILSWESPAKSVSEFLNRGILANAIDKTNINTTTSSTYENATSSTRIPRNSSAFLNQADILNTIAPFIQARSDTFRIRAYGDAINPVTGKLEGRAWCEAWVQRTPELIDNSKDIRNSADGLGRKFKVVHFKWLDESQI